MRETSEPRSVTEETIFAEALALPAGAQRSFIERACDTHGLAAKRVLALLHSHEKQSSFLETPAAEAMLGLVLERQAPPEPAAGDRIGRYQLVERIGEGGFGIVYIAEQREPVRRRVALKLIRLGMDTREFIARFEAERQALALMDHPNIARVFDAGATDNGRPFLVMELVRGVPITRFCEEQRLPLRARLELFIAVCGAIQHAHQKGVIHRDLKPSNILVAREGEVPVPKVIDFGIAKATSGALTERTLCTHGATFVGTPAYTSPEQLEFDARDVDTRSDIYSLGALLYELLAGVPPFARAALAGAGFDEMRRMVREAEPMRPSERVRSFRVARTSRPYAGTEQPETWAGRPCHSGTAESRASRPGPSNVPDDLDWIVMRCLEKDRTRRYESASALALDLRRHLDDEPVLARPPSRGYRLQKFVRKHRLAVVSGAALLFAVVAGSVLTATQAVRALRAERRLHELSAAAVQAEHTAAEARREAGAQAQRLEQVRWARETALPEISRLLKANNIPAAFALATQAEPFLPNDPVLTGLWPQVSAQVTLESTPPGADIYVKPYSQPGAEWQYLGKTPLHDVRLARSVHRWRIEKPGYTTLERADHWFWGQPRRLVWELYENANPPGMVRVQDTGIADFWIDRCEVTNREFKIFVDAGGYATERFWKQAFDRQGETLSWSDAMTLFRDRTGQPGPAGWANGTYPESEAEFPVTGVSWFEAAAYAEFAGKRLPPVDHWRKAAPINDAEALLPLANFGTNGPVAVGQTQSLSSSGALDMAGNAKEWAWNEAPGGFRSLMGGGWAEPDYMFSVADAASPFERGLQFGFRCIKLDPGAQIPERSAAPLPPRAMRDYMAEQPANDDKFEVYRRSYDYARTSLDSRVESMDEDAHRHRQRVSFNATYPGERMAAIIHVPKSARPPYQVVLLVPGSGSRQRRVVESPRNSPIVSMLLDLGRVVVLPIYAGTYERTALRPAEPGEVSDREWIRLIMQDLRRTIDYLETRPREFRTDGVALAGISWGATLGPIASALEPRIKVNILIGGGFTGGKEPAEADPFHFAPRVRAATLMVNGRYDFLRDYQTSQQPFFRALGAEHKQHLIVEGGHGINMTQVQPQIGAWLDRYLGAP